MKNEEAIKYEATTEHTATTLTDAKIKLVGHEEPSRTIANKTMLEKYCQELLSDCAMEEFHLICVNAQCQVLSDSCISRGTLGSVNAYPRNIATVALLSNAHGVFLTHNHPGGTCAPSAEDIRSTGQIRAALKLFDIDVLDHMIVTSTGFYSLRSHGDM